MHTAPYFAAFGILTVLHALRVIRLRIKHKIPFGDGGIENLARMIRVFGNFTEFVPMGLLLLIALEFVQAPVWFMHTSGAAFLAGRTIHAIALGSGTGVNFGRRAGMVLTFLSLLLSSFGILFWSMMEPGL